MEEATFVGLSASQLASQDALGGARSTSRARSQHPQEANRIHSYAPQQSAYPTETFARISYWTIG